MLRPPWFNSLLARSPLPLWSACLLRALTSSLEQFLCLRVLTLLRSLHQASKGTTQLGLRQLSTCLPPRAESITDIYIHTLAQIWPLHCMISSLTLSRSAIIYVDPLFRILGCNKMYMYYTGCTCGSPGWKSNIIPLHISITLPHRGALAWNFC